VGDALAGKKRGSHPESIAVTAEKFIHKKTNPEERKKKKKKKEKGREQRGAEGNLTKPLGQTHEARTKGKKKRPVFLSREKRS